LKQADVNHREIIGKASAAAKWAIQRLPRAAADRELPTEIGGG